MNTMIRAALAPLLLLIATFAPGYAWAVNVGYYEMCNGQGTGNQVAPIIAAGHTPVNITVPDATQLAGVDVLFVTNCDNASFGSEYLANLSAIAAAVNTGGLALVIHDRFVTNAHTILPGGGGIGVFRNFDDHANIDIRASTLVTAGPAGTLTNASLDGGCSSSHGYASTLTLPAGAVNILSTGTPTNSVLFNYKHGSGAVVYSTIPLDFYLGFGNACNIGAALTNIYTPNVIAYAVSLLGGNPPELNGLADVTAEATSAAGAIVTFNVAATDPEDGAIEATCTPASGSLFALGPTPVSCSATDSNGNMVSGGFTATVADTTAPTVDVPGDPIAEALSAAGAVVSFTAYASDAVSGSLTPNCTPASGATFALGTTLVTCTATDAAGNTGSATFKVKVQDTTAPALTCPANISGVPSQTVTLGNPTVSDAVDTTPTLSNNAPGTFPPGLTTVTWTAKDDAGNSNTCQQTVTLRYTFQGFFQPVDSQPAVNTVKNGSTVPVKWRLLDANGTYVTDTSTVQSITYAPTTCGGPEDAIEELAAATGGTALRWDGVSQFIYNWKTPSTAGKCLRLDVRFNDGTTRSANFKLK